METVATDKISPIAIIGMSMKLPGGITSPQTLWDLLYDARCPAGRVPSERFNIDAFYHPDPARLDSIRVQDAHFMKEDPRAFDAPFFSMSPTEACILDPQQRGLLEGAFHTFENAGYTIDKIAGTNTSVFCASFGRDNEAIVSRDPEFQSRYQGTSSGSTMLSNRISHFYDLRGPSITVDTACSSGLYALHLGCQSILSGDSDTSLVCGANVYMTPECMSIPLSNAGFLGPDGRSYSFDHRANGYGRGEGFGLILIKSLHNALRDGDVIRAVIRATGVNQDGRTPSITQPSSKAQVELIRRTYQVGGLDLAHTEYIEAHGTGTPVGDPIEASGIGEVFRLHRTRPIRIGSIKSNIGHLEGASGIAAILKTILVLENGVIPPNANFEKLNPHIDAEALNIEIPTRPIPWPSDGLRRASISSFGYGGSNAHAVLEDAGNYLRLRNLRGHHQSADLSPTTKGGASSTPNGDRNDVANCSRLKDSSESGITQSLAVLVLSSFDEDGILRLARGLKEHLTARPSQVRTREELNDMVYTLSTRRSVFNWRAFVVVDLASSVIAELTDALSTPNFTVSSKTPVLNFVFTGQGSQYARMGLCLMQFPVFKQSVLESNRHLSSLGCDWSVSKELALPEDQSRIHSPALSQALCTIVQVALVDLLWSWNVAPTAVCGHSSGEIAAAYCAGAITRESAWSIAYFRGVVAEGLSSDPKLVPTTMMSVGMSLEDVQPYLKDPEVCVACVNSPKSVTLSGTRESIDNLWRQLDNQEIFAKRLPVRIGYHSKVMQAGAASYQYYISGRIVRPPPSEILSRPTVDFFSSVTGTQLEAVELSTPSYWVRNLVSRVQFSRALRAMSQSRDVKKQGPRVVVEVGPQAGLRRPVQDTLNQFLAPKSWKYVAAMKTAVQDAATVLTLIGELWSVGFGVDINKVNQDSTHAREKPKPMVSLPSYAFNHAKLYWEESRISKAFSFRPYRRHALLGIRDKDWNPAEPAWKQRIRAEENPWIMEHGLNGSPLYPGAGMIAMAIEAVRQLAANESHRIRGYQLKNIRFQKAITVDKSDKGVEVRIQMRQRKKVTNNPIQSWYDWRIYNITSSEEWVECAYGSIRLDLDPKNDIERTIDADARLTRFSKTIKEGYMQDAEKCVLGVPHTQFYDNIHKHSGYDYGDAFRQLRDIKYDRAGHATASLSLRNYMDAMPWASEDPCVIHPTAFDAIFQAQMVALSQGGWERIPTMMFTRLKSLWVSHALFTTPGNPKLSIASHETMRTFREVECKTVVLFDGLSQPVLVSSGQRGTAITSLATSLRSGGKAANLMSYGIDYRPDLSLLIPKEIQEHMESVFRKEGLLPPIKENIDRADALALHFVEAVLEKLDQTGFKQFEGHLEKYVSWMRWVAAHRQKWSLESRGRTDLKIEDIIAEAGSEPSQRLVNMVGTQLYHILTGEKNPLQVIFEGGLVEDFYHSDMFSTNDTKVGAYMRLLVHYNPHMRILELRAGTGSSTAQILPSLICDTGQSQQAVCFAEYAYTDISPGFFEKAQERFGAVSKHMRFQKLDLEVDPISQGFEEGGYDVVIAGNVLHATSNMLRTLSYVKKLLRPGGKLIMGETVNLDNLRDKFVFGLLPGWWLQKEKCWTTDEEYRDQGPLLTEEQWAEVLPMAGFSGLDMVFRDHDQKPYHRVSIIVSSAVEAERLTPSVESLTVVIDAKSAIQRLMAETIKFRVLHELKPAREPVILDVQDALGYDFHKTKAISLLELDQVLLSRIDEPVFNAVKKMSFDAEYLLWVMSGACPKATVPEAEMAVGFGRTVCSEREDQGFITLSLEDPTHQVAKSADRILRVLKSCVSQPPGTNESEYTESNGVINIPRVLPQAHLNDIISSRSPDYGDSRVYTVGGLDPKPHVSLKIETPGLLDTLMYEEDATGEEPPAEGFVEIEVKSTSMNFKDVVIALGQIPGRSFGFDGAGVISRIGPRSRFRVGDSVLYCYSSGGGFGTFLKCPELLVAEIPNDLSFDIAAAIPAVYCTVVYAFDYVAHLRRGDSILIHAGAGGVGQTAIQLAKIKGASEIFVTVGSDVKREFVRDTFGIADDHIFYSRDTSFADDVLNATGGRGVDVVLNSLGGELLQQSLECTAPLGRFIDISKADILADSILPMSVFDHGISFAAVDMVVVQKTNLGLMNRVLMDVVDLFKLHQELEVPGPLRVYHPGELEEAMRYLQSGKSIGKVVVSYTHQGDEIKYRPSKRPAYHFSDCATYLVGGGLGGLGREIIRWMHSRGARNFLILGKSGMAKTPGAAKFVNELEDDGATVWAPACDLSDQNLVQSILKEATTKLPPIKGCIQAAMVLKDSLVEKMSAETLHKALRPKVTGSWNLHKLLPNDLDFFVLLSSFCGIMGNRGQSNYAAGNTYEDALARHRASLGLKGVSIDLALVGETGWAQKNHDTAAKTFRIGHGGIKQSELMTLLDAVCDPSYDCAPSARGAAQVVNIIDSPESLYRLSKEGVLPWMTKPLFSGVLRLGQNSWSTTQDGSTGADDEDDINYVALVVAADSAEEAGDVVSQGLMRKLSKSLCVAPESLDVGKAAHVLGVDSLIAVEVRYWFAKKLAVEVAVFNILKDRSVMSLCEEIATLVRKQNSKC